MLYLLVFTSELLSTTIAAAGKSLLCGLRCDAPNSTSSFKPNIFLVQLLGLGENVWLGASHLRPQSSDFPTTAVIEKFTTNMMMYSMTCRTLQYNGIFSAPSSA